MIEHEHVTRVLLLDEWYRIMRGTFSIQPWLDGSDGFRFQENFAEDAQAPMGGDQIEGPLTSITAAMLVAE